MSYPPAPWTLCGSAVLTLQLLDSRAARAFVPPEIRVVSVLPGKTIACVYAAQYGSGSVLEYNELIVAAALTRLGRHYGFWISHIYVDSPDSQAGGRAIWGLPKELAQFTWRTGATNEVTVRQDDRVLCQMSYGARRWLWRLPVALPNLSTLGRDVLIYGGRWSGRVSLALTRLDVPSDSPFAALGLSQSGLPYHQQEMTFIASAPRAIGHTAVPPRL
jgi:acetoacetate decarboxylase